ncbi:killer toxin alpha/beta [Sarocladium implicatum]|nr:killer toxin alpha/beta [Sarocladium implicatum]
MVGPCTDTAGYISSAEIREILWNRQIMGAREWHDKDSNSDIVVYKGTEWLAWMNDKTKSSRIDLYKGLNFGGVSDWAVDLDKDYGDSGIGSGDLNKSNLSSGKNCPLNKPVLAIGILERMLDRALNKYDDVNNGYDKNFAAYRRVMKDLAKDRAAKYFSWHDGGYRKWFHCNVKTDGTKTGSWSGPCNEMQRHIAVVGMNIVKLTLRDENGFYADLEEQTGVISDWVEFKKLNINTDPNDIAQNCPRPVNQLHPQTCQRSLILSVDNMPKLRDDFEIPDPKEMIKNVKGNLDKIRTSISSRFFDIVTGIWDGGNADVLQVLSVPVFLLAEAIQSMEDAKAKGGEIIKEEKEQLILNIISGLLFFIPFVGEFAAMAAGAAALARMMAIGGLLANTAFSMKDIAGDPSNAAMAIMGLSSAGRLRKPNDFGGLGKARREQTHAGVRSMGPTFKKHDDSLQKVLGNCRRQGNKDDQKEPNACKFKRDLVSTDWEVPDPPVPEHITWLGKRANKNNKNNCDDEVHQIITTTTEFYMKTPDVNCSAKHKHACWHYSSVMRVHANTPDMVRWTCNATPGSSTHGKATDDWGFFGIREDNPPATAQHHGEWAAEWTEKKLCERDEWPPRAFWTQNKVGGKKAGQVIRLLPKEDNRGGGQIWNRFCKKHDGYKKFAPNGDPELQSVTTFDEKINKIINGQTTTYITSYGIRIPRAVFEIKHWEQPVVPDDGLEINPCWPSVLVPNDPGFVLLTDDPWYRNNKPGGWPSTALYKNPPPKHVTAGKMKSRALFGRPIIAPREAQEPEEVLTSPVYDTCPLAHLDEGSEEYLEYEDMAFESEHEHCIMSEDVEKWALSPGRGSSASTTSSHAEPSASDPDDGPDRATPGSGVAPNLAVPT